MNLVVLAALLALPVQALSQGFALGPDPLETWEGNLDYAATGATLLDCGAEGACGGTGGAECRGLSEATATLDVVPQTPTLTVAYAAVRWAASTPTGQGVDESITLTPPGGDPIAVEADDMLTQSFEDGLPADQCQLLGLLCPVESCGIGFYSAGADVTDALNAHLEAGGQLNGQWTVGDVDITGSSLANGQTAVQVPASLTIGAWSLFVVYEDAENLPLRRVYYYQGFELLEGQNRTVRPRGFLAPADPTVDITYLVLEGDDSIRGDALTVNGVEVSDPCNPNRNVFNSTINTGRMDGRCLTRQFGVDIDSFTVEGAIQPGDEQAAIEYIVPRGDGVFTSGEQLFTDWLVMAFDHRLPSFDTVKPQKSAEPPSGSVVSAGDRIDYLIVVENTGGDFASEVVIRDATPLGTTFIPTSAAVDRIGIPDGPEATNPFRGGFNLSDFMNIGRFDPQELHTVTFAVTVNEGLEPGTVIQNIATIDARELDAPVQTEAVVHHVDERTDATIPPPPVPDAGEEPEPDEGVVAPRDMGPPGPEMDAGRCPPGQYLNIAGRCVEEPDADMGPMCFDEDSPCGPGTTLIDGQCQSICGPGLVWDQNCGACGSCRQESADPCEDGEGGGGTDNGCACETVTPTTLALWGLLLLAAPMLRRRRAVSRGR